MIAPRIFAVFSKLFRTRRPALRGQEARCYQAGAAWEWYGDAEHGALELTKVLGDDFLGDEKM